MWVTIVLLAISDIDDTGFISNIRVDKNRFIF